MQISSTFNNRDGSIVFQIHSTRYLVVFSGVCTSALLPCFSWINRLWSVQQQILQFKCFDKIRVPHHSTVKQFYIRQHFVDIIHKPHTFSKDWSISEYGCVVLHNLLHFQSNFSHWQWAIGVSQRINVGNRFFTCVLKQKSEWHEFLVLWI